MQLRDWPEAEPRPTYVEFRVGTGQHAKEMALIRDPAASNNRHIIALPLGGGRKVNIYPTTRLYEHAVFPLLYPTAQGGFQSTYVLGERTDGGMRLLDVGGTGAGAGAGGRRLTRHKYMRLQLISRSSCSAFGHGTSTKPATLGASSR